MANNTLDPQTLALLHSNYLSTQQKPQPQQQPQKKGNLFTNLLPAIGGGLGAVAGIPLDIFGGAGSIAGAAGGSALGEALKEKLTGQNLSAKQIGIQGLEGGALSAFQPLKLVKGASSAAKGFVTGGVDTAANVADNAAAGATADTGSTFAKNLITQGQAAQGRVAGVSAGSKAVGKELTPQDTEAMLGTLKNEGINTGNANNALRDIQSKLSSYGQQISNHFTANNAPLNAADTKNLAANYLSGIKTTDPTVLKQASIVANDLEKNVNDTKSLWEFRKGIDDQIPDAKFGTDASSTAKVSALKNMRTFINSQLGDVPGASNYHALSEIKPFIAGEARRLNNPSGGVIGRVFSSGPAQKIENTLGKTTEKVGQKIAGGSATPPVPPPTDLAGAISQAAPTATSDIPDSVLQEASDAAGQVGNEASLPTTSRAAQALSLIKNTATLPARAVVAPLAYPGKSLVRVAKQVAGRTIGNIAGSAGNTSAPATASSPQSSDLTSALMQAQGGDQADQQPQSQSPYNLQDLQYDTERDPANAAKYIDYYNSLDKIYNPSSTNATVNKPTAQQYGLASSGVQSLQELADQMSQNPNIVTKNATPGQGLPLVGSLISNASGAADYHSLADNVLQAIIHLQTGATATPSEVTAAHGQLPQPGDSETVKQQKLQTLLNDFSPFLGATQ